MKVRNWKEYEPEERRAAMSAGSISILREARRKPSSKTKDASDVKDHTPKKSVSFRLMEMNSEMERDLKEARRRELQKKYNPNNSFRPVVNENIWRKELKSEMVREERRQIEIRAAKLKGIVDEKKREGSDSREESHRSGQVPALVSFLLGALDMDHTDPRRAAKRNRRPVSDEIPKRSRRKC
jgi:hypothetical protein